MKGKELIRKDRITEYIDIIQRQLNDIKSIPVNDKDFFLKRENSIQIKLLDIVLHA